MPSISVDPMMSESQDTESKTGKRNLKVTRRNRKIEEGEK